MLELHITNQSEYRNYLNMLSDVELREEAEEHWGFYEEAEYYTYEALLELMVDCFDETLHTSVWRMI